jgi:hypothetical protein
MTVNRIILCRIDVSMLQIDGHGFDSADVSDDQREYWIVATKAGL